jgi:Tol biopolymer transport system component
MLQRGIRKRMIRMKSIASLLLVTALGFGLVGCSGGGGGGGGSTTSFAVSTTAADYGVVGNPYTSTLAVTGGTGPFTWVLFGGVLPTGLIFNPSTGVVNGIPTIAGNATADFIVTDSTGRTANGSVLFAVHPRTDLLSVNNSVPPVPGNSASSVPSISSDGRIVAFASLAGNLSSGGVGSQIYVHDWQSNQTTLISRNGITSAPTGGNGASTTPSISSDSRYVAFVSGATDLLPAGSQVVSGQQIYVYDRQLDRATLVSQTNAGIPATGGAITESPSISGTGRFIAFVSDAPNLGAPGQQIYLHDTQVSGLFPNGQTILVSKDNTSPTPVAGNGQSDAPSISNDGCFVAFTSAATNLGALANQVHIRGPLALAGCAGTEQTSLVSKDNIGNPASAGSISRRPSTNGNGRFIAFVSDATNFGSSGQQIYLHDTLPAPNGQTILISKDNTSPTAIAGDNPSDMPSISNDGCFVAFTSAAVNLGAPANQVHIRGPLALAGCAGTEQTSLVSKDSTGVPSNGGANATIDPSTSGNGSFVTFSSVATNLVSPSPGNRQIYVRALP